MTELCHGWKSSKCLSRGRTASFKRFPEGAVALHEEPSQSSDC
jgi:hypothetical protein